MNKTRWTTLWIALAIVALVWTPLGSAELGKTATRTKEKLSVDLDPDKSWENPARRGRPAATCSGEAGFIGYLEGSCDEVPTTVCLAAEDAACRLAQSHANQQCRGRKNVCVESSPCGLTVAEITPMNGVCLVRCVSAFEGTCEKTRPER